MCDDYCQKQILHLCLLVGLFLVKFEKVCLGQRLHTAKGTAPVSAGCFPALALPLTSHVASGQLPPPWVSVSS